MKKKQLLTIIIAAVLGGLAAVIAYSALIDDTERTVITQVREPVQMVSLTTALDSSSDFTIAAENTVNAVVHVTTQSTVSYRNPIYDFFYGDRYGGAQRNVEAIGSGVIISENGYIVTNNHVIENSQKVTVVLYDKREFEAELVGTDPTTDLALLKIDADDLHFIPFGNSDVVKVGEWVLAVGNPYNIGSTVTAGIVSAKSRNVGILNDRNLAIESFIQTDAAVNSGNSGGALVNLRGEIIGITSAIVTPSGGNVGISFAIPSSIVEKVVKDLIEYGTVQRAIMGVTIDEVDAELARDNNLDNLEGVYIAGVNTGSAAEEAGIKVGDIITAINGAKVNSPSELQELVGRFRPGDRISVTAKRNGKTQQFSVVLRNVQGSTSVVKAENYDALLGATFGVPDRQERQKLGISGGVKVLEVREGKLRNEEVRSGFIITKINNQQVNSVEELNNILRSVRGGVLLEGVYPDGNVAYYAFGL
ncbi:MAG: Do family serine endopeptidase [Bacteroidales bacterium]|nr:Do family serine endopeptidase [Bacteroidales bacterium]